VHFMLMCGLTPEAKRSEQPDLATALGAVYVPFKQVRHPCAVDSLGLIGHVSRADRFWQRQITAKEPPLLIDGELLDRVDLHARLVQGLHMVCGSCLSHTVSVPTSALPDTRRDMPSGSRRCSGIRTASAHTSLLAPDQVALRQ
jgi:hypothetical protein